MKKAFFLLAFIGLTLIVRSQSQSFHNFKVDLGLGYAIPAANSGGTKAGATFTIQPHYRLTDAIAVGLRIEGAALGYENNTTGDEHVKISVLTSYCASGEYYFTNHGIRPFVGAGAGIFTQSASLDSDNGENLASVHSSKFGFFPEAGIEAGHFRLSADYDIAGNNNNYFAVKLGAFFGGGKRK